jgi:hypothetical protein
LWAGILENLVFWNREAAPESLLMDCNGFLAIMAAVCVSHFDQGIE